LVLAPDEPASRKVERAITGTSGRLFQQRLPQDN
jgi:hypothetical protein